MSSLSRHNLFIQADGTVKSCGINNFGECGLGNSNSPNLNLTVIPGLTDVIQTATGTNHSLFLLKDGTVKSCGNNLAGERGTGDTTPTPNLNLTVIPDLTDVTQVSAGYSYSLFLLKDGTVKSCGYNAFGQCGTGDKITPKLTISVIPGLTNVTQVVAGKEHSLFLLADGTVKSCGNNQYGQCGIGYTSPTKLTPTVISGLTNVTQISSGSHTSLFLLADGTVKSCGLNDYGTCGTGDKISPKSKLTVIPGLTDVAKIESISNHSLFLLKDGTVKSCGNNYYGQCGDGNSVTPKLNIATIPGLADVVQIAGGLNYSLFLLKDGVVKFCGENNLGQGATGDTISPKLALTAISDLNAMGLQSSFIIATPLTPEEQALIDLNTDTVTAVKINTAATLLNTPIPTGYTIRSQKAIAQYMPKKSDADFADYTPENFQARLDAATEKAKKKHKEMKSFYNFLSKLPSMKI